MAMNFGGKLPVEHLMDTFDPNVEPEGDWATYIPRWRGAWHVHRTRAAALRACNPRFASNSVLYHRESGRWVEVERHDYREPDPTGCELCGKPANPHDIFDTLERRWVKKRGRVLDPPRSAWMCAGCMAKNY